MLADGFGVESPIFTLEGGETRTETFNLTERFDVLRDNHTVSSKTNGGSVKFDFTENLNASSSDIAAPYITNVGVLRYEENDSTALRVSVQNPSKLGYNYQIRAYTFETNGAATIGATLENKTDRYVVPLEEASDDIVAGKVRIYADRVGPDGKFDQKEFMAKPGNEINAWDDHFKSIPEKPNEVSYENETARQYRDGYVDKDALSPLERRAGAGLLVALLIGAVWWRRR